MDICEQSQLAIVSALKEAIGHYAAGEKDSVITDIHLLPRQDSGELVIFDDDDEELARTIIDEWVDYESDDFYTQVEPLLRSAVMTLKDEGALDKLCLLKPYSFVLVDDEKETVAELLLMDEPFASLDFLTRAELQSQLLDIQEKLPRTIVLVTHQLEEALLLGRRIIVMHPDSTICEFDLTDLPYPRDLDDPTLRRLKEAITDQCRYTA